MSGIEPMSSTASSTLATSAPTATATVAQGRIARRFAQLRAESRAGFVAFIKADDARWHERAERFGVKLDE